MPVRLLLDEHLRGVPWHALSRARETYPELTFTRVGDPPDLPLGVPDDRLLDWAATHRYVLVSADLKTMPDHFTSHLQAGKQSTGLILVPSSHDLSATIQYLIAVALCTDESEWVDHVEYAP